MSLKRLSRCLHRLYFFRKQDGLTSCFRIEHKSLLMTYNNEEFSKRVGHTVSKESQQILYLNLIVFIESRLNFSLDDFNENERFEGQFSLAYERDDSSQCKFKRKKLSLTGVFNSVVKLDVTGVFNSIVELYARFTLPPEINTRIWLQKIGCSLSSSIMYFC